MIKARVTPHSNTVNLTIPNDYVGKDIEILIYKTDEANSANLSQGRKSDSTMAQFWGVLSDDSANDLQKTVKELREDWENRNSKQF